MNETRPPFDDLKVRQAVNYAIDSRALERIYAGQIKALHQILPPGIPGHKPYNLYPHNIAKAEKLIAEANPSDRDITVWTDNESPQEEVGAYYQDVLKKLGFNAKLKVLGESFFTVLGNESTPDLDTGWIDWYEDYPHPNDFFQTLLSGESILPTNNTNTSHTDYPDLNAKITRLSEEPLGSKQEAEYAELDKEFMERAPWAPYGTRTLSTFVSDAINLEGVIFNPTFGQYLTSFEFK
jgi:peptide/nickel transport system substrate-binding protein